MNIAANVAIHKKIPVGIFSLEMPKEALAKRLLCAESSIDSLKIDTSNLKDSDYKQMSKAVERLSNAPIFIDDSAEMTILQIQTKARRLKAEQDIKLIVLDFLTLIKSSGQRRDSNRYLEVSDWARTLKALAKELAVPVIVISQLNREVEKGGGNISGSRLPKISDLRDSGEIEQVADVVLLLHCPSYQDTEGAVIDHTIEIHVAKNRNGPIGKARLAFLKKFSKFENLEQGGTPPDAPV
ncbi:replicative DNA helicase DnaB [Candidatus Termititenax spirochaetophilus]|uniref:Replicative DNA helicase DnaB n=1 Tax=Candidatus Termititenax spirochaetophilus TaxID=2218522 RepID=A0A388T6Q5_9BACT|nr:replicative DNA helicase DnaB [Candidatus Termititenax spirochaetophilus]